MKSVFKRVGAFHTLRLAHASPFRPYPSPRRDERLVCRGVCVPRRRAHRARRVSPRVSRLSPRSHECEEEERVDAPSGRQGGRIRRRFRVARPGFARGLVHRRQVSHRAEASPRTLTDDLTPIVDA